MADDEVLERAVQCLEECADDTIGTPSEAGFRELAVSLRSVASRYTARMQAAEGTEKALDHRING